MRKKILWTLPVMLLAIVSGMAFKAYAGTGESGRGWLWDGSESVSDAVLNGNESGIGWISMNSLDCDVDGNGFFDASCGGDNAATLAMNYGVSIPLASGAVSGYAWSEQYGWISFNGSDLAGCPVGSCSTQRVGNNLTGWARILSIKNDAETNNSGGWSGWISLDSATAGSPTAYGVDVTKMDGTGANPTYAWSDELGWIDFSRASVVAVRTLRICPSNPTISQGTSNYQLHAYYNTGADCTDTLSEVTSSATWGSGNPTAVTVGSSTGLVDARATGSTSDAASTITATYNPGSGNISATTTVTVPGLCSADPTCRGTFNVAAECSNDPSKTCTDSCGNVYRGTKSCGISSWKEVAP